MMQYRPLTETILARQHLQSPREVKDYKNKIAEANDTV